MNEELKTLTDMKETVRDVRQRAVGSVHDSRTALRMVKALVLLREADAILNMEVKKIEDGVMFSSELARAALGWNLNSVSGRLLMAKDILEGRKD